MGKRQQHGRRRNIRFGGVGAAAVEAHGAHRRGRRRQRRSKRAPEMKKKAGPGQISSDLEACGACRRSVKGGGGGGEDCDETMRGLVLTL